MIITPDLRPCKAASDWLCYLVMNHERVTLLEDRGQPEPQSRSQTSALTACFPRRFSDTELCIDVLQTAERCVTTCHTPCGASLLPARGWRANAPCPEVARASFRFLPPDTQPRPWSQSWCRRNPSGMGTGPLCQRVHPRRLRGEPPARAPAQRGLYLAIPLPVPPHSPPANGECSRRATFQMTRVYVDSDRQPC